MKLGFVMDPIEEININRDSTFATMLEAQDRGHSIWYTTPDNMWAENNKVYASISQITVERSNNYYKKISTEIKNLDFLDVIFMRKDPPFDLEYIYSTYLLDLIKNKIPIINRPDGIRNVNEKAFILNFPTIITDTLITKNIDVLKDFLKKVGGLMVIKPLNRKGGEGIFIVKSEDKNTQSLLEMSTHYGKVSIMAQKYIPEATIGDKRIILINGEPIASFLRVPDKRDHRGNLCAGATIEKSEITKRDIEICKTIKPELLKNGLYFVGIDIIGNYLSEINVTSPTGFQEIANLTGIYVEKYLLDFVEKNYKH